MREEEEGEDIGVDGEERQRDESSGEPKVNPIKINLKMLKVTEANGKTESEGLDSTAASSLGPASSATPKTSQTSTPTPKPAHSPKPTGVRGKKTADQLHLLKQVYARTQWPSATQYDELISSTGLPRPEVVRWFGDCRYVQKNGQLKWLESYQNMALEEDLQKGNVHVLQAHLDVHGRLEDSQVSTAPNIFFYSSVAEKHRNLRIKRFLCTIAFIKADSISSNYTGMSLLKVTLGF